MITIGRAVQLLDEQKEPHEEEINEALNMGIAAILKCRTDEVANYIAENREDFLYALERQDREYLCKLINAYLYPQN
jgi:hypothetical protein